MINTKELTIGCYVKVNGKPHKVDGVFSNAVRLEKWDTLFHYSDLEPIPITKELLVKNEFIENIDDSDCCFSKVIGGYRIILAWDVANHADIWLNIFGKDDSCLYGGINRVQHIHQVQNLMNILGVELKLEL